MLTQEIKRTVCCWIIWKSGFSDKQQTSAQAKQHPELSRPSQDPSGPSNHPPARKRVSSKRADRDHQKPGDPTFSPLFSLCLNTAALAITSCHPTLSPGQSGLFCTPGGFQSPPGVLHTLLGFFMPPPWRFLPPRVLHMPLQRCSAFP